MELHSLITWGIGLAVMLLAGAWSRLASRVSRNNEATAQIRGEVGELRGRVSAYEGTQKELAEELRNVHSRIGGVDRTTNQIAGQMMQFGNTLNIIHEHLLQQGKPRP